MPNDVRNEAERAQHPTESIEVSRNEKGHDEREKRVVGDEERLLKDKRDGDERDEDPVEGSGVEKDHDEEERQKMTSAEDGRADRIDERDMDVAEQTEKPGEREHNKRTGSVQMATVERRDGERVRKRPSSYDMSIAKDTDEENKRRKGREGRQDVENTGTTRPSKKKQKEDVTATHTATNKTNVNVCYMTIPGGKFMYYSTASQYGTSERRGVRIGRLSVDGRNGTNVESRGHMTRLKQITDDERATATPLKGRNDTTPTQRRSSYSDTQNCSNTSISTKTATPTVDYHNFIADLEHNDEQYKKNKEEEKRRREEHERRQEDERSEKRRHLIPTPRQMNPADDPFDPYKVVPSGPGGPSRGSGSGSVPQNDPYARLPDGSFPTYEYRGTTAVPTNSAPQQGAGPSTVTDAQRTSQYRSDVNAGAVGRGQGLRGGSQRTPKGRQDARPSIAERDPEQYVTCMPNDTFPRDKRGRTRYVTKKDPIYVSFTKEMRYAHVNAVGDHRYHRAEHRANRVPNPGAPIGVNEYIQQCNDSGMLEGRRYAVMGDDPTGRETKSRQKAWRQRWAHSGRDGQMTRTQQPADTYWVRCSGEIEYQRKIGPLIQLLTERAELDCNNMITIPSILPRPISCWYMFHDSKDWDEDALFENRARTSRHVFRQNQTEPTIYPGIYAGWQDVGMYNISAEERRQLYGVVDPDLRGHECSRILPCPSPPLFNYALRQYREANPQLKTRIRAVLEKETVDLLVAAFIHAARHGIRYSRQGDPRITVSDGFGILTPIPTRTMNWLTTPYLLELFHNSEYDVGLVILAVERQRQIDWNAIAEEMPDPFLWYEWHTGRVVSLPIRDCREVTVTDQKVLQNWCVRVFPVVDVRVIGDVTMTVQRARDLAQQWIAAIHGSGSAAGNNDAEPLPNPPPSPTEVEDGEAEDQRQELLAHADTWYNNLELLMRPTLTLFRIPYIPNVTEFIKNVKYWLECSVAEKKHKVTITNLTKANADAETRVKAAESNATVLAADLRKQRTEVSRLTTTVATAHARIAELERELRATRTELTTVRNAAEDASAAVFDIQGTVTNITRELDDAIQNAVVAARLRVDNIRNPTAGAPRNTPGGANSGGNAVVSTPTGPPSGPAGG